MCTSCNMKANIRYIILLLLLFPVISAKAQFSIKGNITDSKNNSLELAVITLKKDTLLIGTYASDSLGRFSINNIPAGTYNWKVTYVNHVPDIRTITVEKNILLNVRLELSVSHQTATITSKKPIIERKIDRLVFNVENSLAALSGDAMDVLAIAPGVVVEYDNVSLIGKGNVSVMINDKMIHLAGLDLINFIKAIPSNSIEKIEIMTNPSSAYSAEGNGGIINIKLKKAQVDFWSTTLRTIYSLTTYPTGTGNINFDFKKKKLTLSTGVNYTNGSMEATEKPTIIYSNQKWVSGIVRRDYNVSYSGRFLADYDFSKRVNAGMQVFYSHAVPHNHDINRTEITKTGNLLPDSVLVANGLFSGRLDNVTANVNTIIRSRDNKGKVVIDLDYYHSENDRLREVHSHAFDQTRDSISGSHWYTRNKGNNWFTNFSLNIDAQKEIKKGSIRYGGRYLASTSENSLDSKAIANYTVVLVSNNDRFKFNEKTTALFASLQQKVSGHFDLQAGLRSEYTATDAYSFTTGKTKKNSYFQLFPTLFGVYTVNDNHAFVISYGRRIERPQYTSLNPFQRYLAQNYYSVGNPELMPSYVHNFELTYGYKDFAEITFYTSLSTNQPAQISYANPVTKLVVDTIQNVYSTNTYGFKGIFIVKGVKWLESSTEANTIYSAINQQADDLPQNNKGWVGFFNSNNTFKISNAFAAQANFWYSSPRYRGVFRQSAKGSVSLGFRWRFYNSRVNLNILANDIFKTSQSDLSTNINGVYQFYNNFYDNRYFRVTLQYKFGSMKVQTKQRNGGNEDERNRAN